MSRWRRPGRIAGTVAGVGALDAVITARRWSVPMLAGLDWPAHVATAALALGALPPRLRPASAGWALAGSVAIDLDHVPLYLGLDRVAAHPGGRPVTHSLATPAALLAGARLTQGRVRAALAGLSGGVLLHFVRDVGTGPGLPLLWPFSRRDVRIPYAAYLAPVAAAALARALTGPRTPAA